MTNELPYLAVAVNPLFLSSKRIVFPVSVTVPLQWRQFITRRIVPIT